MSRGLGRGLEGKACALGLGAGPAAGAWALGLGAVGALLPPIGQGKILVLVMTARWRVVLHN